MSTGGAVRRTAAVERGIASADEPFSLECIREGAVVPEPGAWLRLRQQSSNSVAGSPDWTAKGGTR